MTRTLFNDLDREWEYLGSSRRSVAQLSAWAMTDVALQRFADLAELVAFARQPGHPAESDVVLACLARRAACDDLAARTLLQAVLYALVKLAGRYRTAVESPQEVASMVVAEAYEKIRTYPIDRRPRRIAANVLLDTQQSVSRSLFRRRVVEVLAEDVGELTVVEITGESTLAGEELLDLVEAAVRAGKLQPRDARLIVMTRLTDIAPNAIGASCRRDPQTIRQRRRRAERALAHWARSQAAA